MLLVVVALWPKTGKLSLSRYYTDPSGTFWQCNAKAIGSGSEGADSTLQEQYNKVLLHRLLFALFPVLRTLKDLVIQ